MAMTLKILHGATALLLTAFLSGPALAQQSGQGIITYLQKEPVTLFDLGMKRLRSAALDTVAKMTPKPGMEPLTSVRYDHATGLIEITYNLKVEATGGIEQLRQRCVEDRMSIILKMFRVGLTDFTSLLSVTERIQRRIGAQFTHEPIASTKEALSLSEHLGQIAYTTLTLTNVADPNISVSCRALTTDLVLH